MHFTLYSHLFAYNALVGQTVTLLSPHDVYVYGRLSDELQPYCWLNQRTFASIECVRT